MISLIYFLFALGVIVLVHELGHLLVAKKYGVFCHEFSIGMGPKIKHLGTDKSGTIYSIRAIPLGGYVMMAGEDSDSKEDTAIDPDKLLNNKKPYQKFLVLIAGATMNFILGLILLFLIGFLGGVSVNSGMVDVMSNSPAEVAGITDKSVINAIDGINVSNFEDISSTLSNDTNKDVVLNITDPQGNASDVTVERNEENMIGISAYKEKFHLFGAIKYAIKTFGLLVFSIIVTLKMLFGPEAGLNDLSGPIGIFTVSSQVVDFGLNAMLLWIVYLSINIGFVNLLPIPALDGGRIVFVLYEMIFRRPAPKKFELYVTYAGLILLMLLFVYVSFNDIIRVFK